MRFPLFMLFIAAIGCGPLGLERMDTGASGAAELGVEPEGNVRFGKVSPSTEKSVVEEILLYSAGNGTLAIVDVYLDDSSSGAYSMRGDLPLPVRLTPGSEFPVQVRFSPYAVGTFSGELVVLFDDGTEEGESVRISIVGEGCADPDETGSCSD